jgi:hypothetical protein
MCNSYPILGKLENAAFHFKCSEFGRNHLFPSNLDIIFRKVQRIRILIPNYFKIIFGTVIMKLMKE